MSAEQHATLYRNPKRLLAYPSNRTIDGFNIAAPPFLRLEDNPEEIGAAIRQVLSDCRDGIPSPKRESFAAIARPRLEAAAVRSEAAFIRRSQLVSILRKELIRLVPHRNGGTIGDAKGFVALPEKQIVLPLTADDVVLGRAGLEALRRCE